MARLSKVAWGVLAYTVAVILWGAYVRATGSGAGCGDHWPLCDGELLPRAASTEMAIELTHRITSGLAWIAAAVLAWQCWRHTDAGHPARRASLASLFFMTTEAAIGAGLVLFELVADDASSARGIWMTAHLVNTLLLLAALSLTAWHLGAHRDATGAGRRIVWLFAATLLGVVLLGASGAIAALGDTLFPASSLEEAMAQDLAPTAHALIRLRVFHPLIALVVGAGILFTAGWAAVHHPRGSTARGLAVGLAVLFVAQVALGFANIALLAPVWLQIVHLLVADLIWIALVLLTAATVGVRAPARATA